MAPRILLCGDVLGKLSSLFKRVASVSKANGPFDALLCVGQFFPANSTDVEDFLEFIEERREVPLPTYFVGDYGEGSGKLLASAKAKIANDGLQMEGMPICKNLFWLKGSGVFDLAGLRVAYLGGRYEASIFHNPTKSQSNGSYHEDDVDALRALADEPGVIDLFLTNEWPLGVLNGVTPPPGINSADAGVDVVAELVVELKPRYHVAGSEGAFYSREPYTNENACHVTRFVGLAAVANENRQKFLHALSPTPASLMSSMDLGHRPIDTTPSPFMASASKDTCRPKSRDLSVTSAHDSEGQYWRFSTPQSKRQKGGEEGTKKVCFEFMSKGSCSRGDACNFKHGTPLPKGACFDFITKGKCERGPECKFRHNSTEGEDAERRPKPSAPCWFCLASPDIDVHLVVNVGEHCYCAIAKGALTEGHVLVLPIEHLPSIVSLPRDTVQELHKFKASLKGLYRKGGKTMVIFERYLQLRAGTHAHLQIVPIPMAKASQARGAFFSAAKELGFDFHVILPGDNIDPHEALRGHLEGGKNYFYVELPEGTVLAHVLEPGENMPLQFGREVCAKLLGIPERSDWKACILDRMDEVAKADRFKEEFEAYNSMG